LVQLISTYQRDRILSFFNPSQAGMSAAAETSTQYNSRQALIAVGSGGLFGRGLGYGIQSHLRFLPERQTDFIFAALAEELGLVGSLLVLGCYIMLISLLWRLIFHQTDLKKIGFLISFTLLLFIQTAINIGMNIGLLPITGVTLPFLSYGGSSILGFALGLGVTQVISHETKKRLALQIR
jgi:rod shape determining protein RodA